MVKSNNSTLVDDGPESTRILLQGRLKEAGDWRGQFSSAGERHPVHAQRLFRRAAEINISSDSGEGTEMGNGHDPQLSDYPRTENLPLPSQATCW